MHSGPLNDWIDGPGIGPEWSAAHDNKCPVLWEQNAPSEAFVDSKNTDVYYSMNLLTLSVKESTLPRVR